MAAKAAASPIGATVAHLAAIVITATPTETNCDPAARRSMPAPSHRNTSRWSSNSWSSPAGELTWPVSPLVDGSDFNRGDDDVVGVELVVGALSIAGQGHRPGRRERVENGQRHRNVGIVTATCRTRRTPSTDARSGRLWIRQQRRSARPRRAACASSSAPSSAGGQARWVRDGRPQAVACVAERDRPPQARRPAEGSVGFTCGDNDNAVVLDPADARRAPMDATGALAYRSG
jgi:hypothetical protein